MRKYYLLLILLVFKFAGAQNVVFSDQDFRLTMVFASTTNNIAKDINGNSMVVDVNHDSQIQISEALAVYQLDVNDWNGAAFYVIDYFGGIQYFTNLTHFNCNSQTTQEPIDLTALVNLVEVDCSNTYTPDLKVSNLPNLKILNCESIFDTDLDLTGLVSLENLDCSHSSMTTMDLSPCVKLKTFRFETANDLPALTIENLPDLEEVYLSSGNFFVGLTLHNLPNLRKVYCNNSDMAALDLLDLPELRELYCEKNDDIEVLNLSGMNKLEKLDCSENKITGAMFLQTSQT